MISDLVLVLLTGTFFQTEIGPGFFNLPTGLSELCVPVAAVGLCGLFAANGHYDGGNSFIVEVAQIVTGIAFIIVVPWAVFGFQAPVGLGITILFGLIIGRILLKWLLFRLRLARRPTLLIGPAARCKAVKAALDRDWYRGFEVQEQINCNDFSFEAGVQDLMTSASGKTGGNIVLVVDRITEDAVKFGAFARQFGMRVSVILPSMQSRHRLVIDRIFSDNLVIISERASLSSWQPDFVKRTLDLSLGILILFLPHRRLLLLPCWSAATGGQYSMHLHDWDAGAKPSTP